MVKTSVKTQPLAVIKIQISIHQKKVLSELCVEWSLLVVANSIDAEVAHVFNFSHKISIDLKFKNCRYYSRLVLDAPQFFHKEQPMGHGLKSIGHL